MKHTDLPVNSASIRLYINHEGQVDGELAWNCSDKLDEQYVDALVESIHGLLALVTTQFDTVRMAGKTFMAGQQTASDSDDGEITFTPDFEEEVAKNIVPLTKSKRKH
jgi:hypothetical protein